MSTILLFKDVEIMNHIYRGKDYMKNAAGLHCTKILKKGRKEVKSILKRKNMKLLTNEQQESCENAKYQLYNINMLKIKIIVKL